MSSQQNNWNSHSLISGCDLYPVFHTGHPLGHGINCQSSVKGQNHPATEKRNMWGLLSNFFLGGSLYSLSCWVFCCCLVFVCLFVYSVGFLGFFLLFWCVFFARGEGLLYFFNFPKSYLCFRSLNTILKGNAKVWSWFWNTKILLPPLFIVQEVFLNCLLSLPAACPLAVLFSLPVLATIFSILIRGIY